MDFLQRLLYALTELHPIHPMMVHFPIGLTGGATFFMLLALWRKHSLLEQIAFANLALSVPGTLVAGLTGLMDNARNYDGQAPNVEAKIGLAIVLLLLTTLTVLLRWRTPTLFTSPFKPFYVAAYFLSFGLAIVLAFLGGIILYGF